jgi:hypothetical protein
MLDLSHSSILQRKAIGPVLRRYKSGIQKKTAIDQPMMRFALLVRVTPSR